MYRWQKEHSMVCRSEGEHKYVS